MTAGQKSRRRRKEAEPRFTQVLVLLKRLARPPSVRRNSVRQSNSPSFSKTDRSSTRSSEFSCNTHAVVRPTDCQSNDSASIELEVFGPLVAARIKQPDAFVRIGITARQVRALAQIALVAGEREIFGAVRAAMLARVDVFDVERMRAFVFLTETAILATIAGALPHLLAEDQRDHEVA
jgi:hypothetical protein